MTMSTGKKHIILGIHILDRMKDAVEVQKLFTKYGSHIKTRLGLHEVSGDFCAPGGIVILEMHGEETVCRELGQKLQAIDGIEVKEMIFTHPEV
ncbi:MAG TPA: hypothetical protein PKY35_12685 [Candidatus Hydrogenedentes bacterium]|nr:hypothetical protein [Candidatus Hydrogenedentota bacterium]HOL77873.1 hypothetical protein [Candidatus Hydrogenedentota bacterium]HPO87038.1 hypothetical protein [Candidatus Hydrogenedentota bacterium]